MTEATNRRHALVVAPLFFGYEQDIVAEFERRGYETVFVDERPSNSAIGRAVLRVRKTLVGRQIDNYYRQKWSELAGTSFDIVLVIKAEVIPRWFLEKLRKANPDARLIFYSWDAVDNTPNCVAVLDCFDELFSFDADDVAARPEFSYLPLFYTQEFEPLPTSEAANPRSYTMSFIGTLHSERYAFAKRLFAGRSGTYGFFYVQARWYFAMVKYLTREHSAVPWSDVSFDKLSRLQVAQIFRESVAVLDMPRRGQAGLTIRTFEVLASGAVLVTTNPAVIREPFYDPARVIVIPDDLDEDESKRALAQIDSIVPPQGPPPSFDRYSLASWVAAIVAAPSRSGGVV
ncbi:hypothetical protein SAMN02799620_05061 [Mycolicibacterium fluoranthenivorans]|uniref:Spore protein YkvP/CgeB glycosyl transferase-like domain-containing protein n=2 Tax=Mycolicibacterium fluoranthenivorans TaxID=258505 RepID=A0A1G4WVF3_9MYCO|nr:hypothetical protein SAMN02799620_05061 [Mycolicibacterium fluoranthenivorans]